MTIAHRVLSALLTCAIVALLGAAVEGGPAAGPPFSAGTTWTYKITLTKDGQTRVGTSTETYRGLSPYGGARYHLVEQAWSLIPGFAQRAFLTWDGHRFRQVVSVETDGKNTAEVIFDKAIPLGAQDASSGTAKIIVDGTPQGSAPWSFTSVSPGKESVSVPAGSFRAQRWDAVLRLGALESRIIVHIVGITDVRVEASQTVTGAPVLAFVKELRRGPIR